MIAIDVSMPKNCDECIIRFNGAFFNCGVCNNFQNDDHDGGRNHNCPLIEVTHATDEILVDERLIEDIFPGKLSEGVREIHASRMGKFISDHPEVMKTECENYGNGSRRYLANCYMVNVNQEAKNGEADNQ